MKYEMLTGSGPLYIRLYEYLKGKIVSGAYPYGSRFPSKRILSERLGISLITVEHCLTLLAEEGYLESRQRSGTYVIYQENDLFSVAAAGKISDLPLTSYSSVTDAADFPFSSYAKTMRKVISDCGRILLDRVPSGGLPVLRSALSGYLRRSRNLYVDPAQIFIGAGSEYFYGLIVQFFGRDRIYAIEQPSYEKIELVYRANGASLELLPLSKNGISTTALSASSASVLHITPYRSYPSGVSTSASRRRDYVRWAESRDAYIIEDDFESEFTPSSKPEETVFSLSEKGNVLYLNSFTKTISPAARISYLILPERLVKPYNEKLGFYACTVPSFDQYVLAEFIESGEFERHINRIRRKKRREGTEET